MQKTGQTQITDEIRVNSKSSLVGQTEMGYVSQHIVPKIHLGRREISQQVKIPLKSLDTTFKTTFKHSFIDSSPTTTDQMFRSPERTLKEWAPLFTAHTSIPPHRLPESSDRLALIHGLNVKPYASTSVASAEKQRAVRQDKQIYTVEDFLPSMQS